MSAAPKIEPSLSAREELIAVLFFVSGGVLDATGHHEFTPWQGILVWMLAVAFTWGVLSAARATQRIVRRWVGL
jgi:cytochrome b subunit of formate dehydrogenase